MFGPIQGGCKEVWGAYRVWGGCTDVVVIQTPTKHTDSQTYPHMPAK